MDKATIGNYLEILRVFKFLLTPTHLVSKFAQKIVKNWSLNLFCDSDGASDFEKRISVTGFIVYMMNVPIYWRSKTQRTVTLYSSKAEYFRISELFKDIKLI
jgi:hypothetical protein